MTFCFDLFVRFFCCRRSAPLAFALADSCLRNSRHRPPALSRPKRQSCGCIGFTETSFQRFSFTIKRWRQKSEQTAQNTRGQSRWKRQKKQKQKNRPTIATTHFHWIHNYIKLKNDDFTLIQRDAVSRELLKKISEQTRLDIISLIIVNSQIVTGRLMMSLLGIDCMKRCLYSVIYHSLLIIVVVPFVAYCWQIKNSLSLSLSHCVCVVSVLRLLSDLLLDVNTSLCPCQVGRSTIYPHCLSRFPSLSNGFACPRICHQHQLWKSSGFCPPVSAMALNLRPVSSAPCGDNGVAYTPSVIILWIYLLILNHVNVFDWRFKNIWNLKFRTSGCSRKKSSGAPLDQSGTQKPDRS